MSLNQAQLIGSIGSSEVRTTAGGKQVLNFTLATNFSYKQGEEWVNGTDWHKVTVFSPSQYLAENIIKGAKVYVSGPMKTDQFEKNGVKMSSTKIIGNDVQVLVKAGAKEAPTNAPSPAPTHAPTSTPVAAAPAVATTAAAVAVAATSQNDDNDFGDWGFDDGSELPT